MVAPNGWNGTAEEATALSQAVQRYCIVTLGQYPTCTQQCGAHALWHDDKLLPRLVFMRRVANRLRIQEFDEAYVHRNDRGRRN